MLRRHYASGMNGIVNQMVFQAVQRMQQSILAIQLLEEHNFPLHDSFKITAQSELEFEVVSRHNFLVPPETKFTGCFDYQGKAGELAISAIGDISALDVPERLGAGKMLPYLRTGTVLIAKDSAALILQLHDGIITKVNSCETKTPVKAVVDTVRESLDL